MFNQMETAQMRKGSCVVMGLFLLMGCSKAFDHRGKMPLVKVDDAFLYKEDVDAALPVGIKGEDSIRFVEKYIRNWVEDILLYRKAEGNIPDNSKIDEQVATYRQALIKHVYQEELVRQKLTSEVTEMEISSYYQAHADLFRADCPYIQGIFIKIPLHTQGIDKVRKWYKQNTQEAIDGLEKFGIAHAVGYEYFYGQWHPVSEFASKLPLPILDRDADYLNRNKNVEVCDTAFHYFLHVEKFLPKGEPLPLEYARNEIKEMIINMKRVEFINRMKNNLYKEALEKNNVIYYNPSSNE